MKFSPVFLSLLLFISCSNQDANRSNTVTAAPVKKDVPPFQKARANPYAAVDVSPMDISYFPDDFPVLKMTKAVDGLPIARVIYSRPHRQGRKIFGDLLKYGEPWRLGANEASELEFFRDVTIQNKRISKGKYIIYCIPQADNWTIVLNSNLYSWGLKMDPKKDLYKFQIPVQHTNASIEFFTMVFEQAKTGANLVMAWDDAEARLPISF